MRVGTALMPSEIDFRLSQLEADEIASLVRVRTSSAYKMISDAGARVENWIIGRLLLRAVKSGTAAGGNDAQGLEKLSRIRSATAAGRFGIFSPMAMITPDPGAAATDEMAVDHDLNAWEDEVDPDDPILMYIPGGGFILPPSPKQVALAFRLAESCGCEAIIGKHRLAPENPFPAPVKDLVDQYARLLSSGISAKRIIISGDSAGATLALSMLIELRARKLPMPAGAMLFSPWADLSLSGWSYITKSLSSESPFRMETAAFSARLYLGDTLPTDPRASPAFAALTGFPPLAIHCSRHDMHFDDAVTLAEKAKDAGVPIRMNYWNSPRHHLERFRSKDAEKSFKLAAEFTQGLLRDAA